jgi:acyl-CoA synthetase (AMP-forming)/AMP-acid ligase II
MMIYRSPYPDVELPRTPITPLALRHADQLAAKPALIDAVSGRQLTYAELRDAVERVATGLAERGVQQGDVVAMYAPNSIEYAVTFHAVATLGAIVSTVNPLYLSGELERHLALHGATYLVVAEGLVERAEEAIENLSLRECFVIGQSSRHTTFDDLAGSTGCLPVTEIDPENDVVAIMCSSGTTGIPKGVMLTHKALVSMAVTTAASTGMTERDVIPAHLPFFHVFGVLSTLTTGFAMGFTNVILSRFDFEQYLQLIQDYRVTRTFATPPILVQLAKNPVVANYDLSSLGLITSGAAPLSAETEALVRERVGCQINQGYGMTEVVPSHICPDNVPASKQGSVGMCVANHEAMVVAPESGRRLDPGETGEIWVRGSNQMIGYLNDPEATATTLDSEGWIHTGDLGYADEDGYFYIIDRLKELIKYKAYQVAPAELEALLLTHPAIADAAVVRYPDEDAGEIPKAFVVARGPLDADDLMAWVAERVAPHKKVRRVEFIDAIPKSASGKILRRELIARDQAQLAVPV